MVLRNLKIIVMLLIAVLMFTSLKLYAQNSDTVYVTTKKYTNEYQQRKQARTDITNGNVFIFRKGWLGVNKETDSLASIYGFKFIQEGSEAVEGREYYNDEVIRYLNKRNGNGWWEDFLKQESRLEKKEIPFLPERKEK